MGAVFLLSLSLLQLVYAAVPLVEPTFTIRNLQDGLAVDNQIGSTTTPQWSNDGKFLYYGAVTANTWPADKPTLVVMGQEQPGVSNLTVVQQLHYPKLGWLSIVALSPDSQQKYVYAFLSSYGYGCFSRDTTTGKLTAKYIARYPPGLYGDTQNFVYAWDTTNNFFFLGISAKIQTFGWHPQTGKLENRTLATLEGKYNHQQNAMAIVDGHLLTCVYNKLWVYKIGPKGQLTDPKTYFPQRKEPNKVVLSGLLYDAPTKSLYISSGGVDCIGCGGQSFGELTVHSWPQLTVKQNFTAGNRGTGWGSITFNDNKDIIISQPSQGTVGLFKKSNGKLSFWRWMNWYSSGGSFGPGLNKDNLVGSYFSYPWLNGPIPKNFNGTGAISRGRQFEVFRGFDGVNGLSGYSGSFTVDKWVLVAGSYLYANPNHSPGWDTQFLSAPAVSVLTVNGSGGISYVRSYYNYTKELAVKKLFKIGYTNMNKDYLFCQVGWSDVVLWQLQISSGKLSVRSKIHFTNWTVTNIVAGRSPSSSFWVTQSWNKYPTPPPNRLTKISVDLKTASLTQSNPITLPSTCVDLHNKQHKLFNTEALAQDGDGLLITGQCATNGNLAGSTLLYWTDWNLTTLQSWNLSSNSLGPMIGYTKEDYPLKGTLSVGPGDGQFTATWDERTASGPGASLIVVGSRGTMQFHKPISNDADNEGTRGQGQGGAVTLAGPLVIPQTDWYPRNGDRLAQPACLGLPTRSYPAVVGNEKTALVGFGLYLGEPKKIPHPFIGINSVGAHNGGLGVLAFLNQTNAKILQQLHLAYWEHTDQWLMLSDGTISGYKVDTKNACPDGCGMHGKCVSGKCECQHGWSGVQCCFPTNRCDTFTTKVACVTKGDGKCGWCGGAETTTKDKPQCVEVYKRLPLPNQWGLSPANCTSFTIPALA